MIITPIALLLLQLIVISTGQKDYSLDNINSIPSPYILVLAMPAHGHLTPMLELAQKLQETNSRAIVAPVFDIKAKEIKLSNITEALRVQFPSLNVINLPLLESEVCVPKMNRQGSILSPYWLFNNIDRIFSEINEIYLSLLPILAENPPIVIIYEEFTPVGAFIASKLKVPGVAIAPHIEIGLSKQPLNIPSMITFEDASPEFLWRARNAFKRTWVSILRYAAFSRMRKFCNKLGFPHSECWDIQAVASRHRHLILGLSSGALLRPTPLPLNLQLCGPLISLPKNNSKWNAKLSEISNENRGIVFISMGSDMNMKEEHVRIFLEVLDKVASEKNLHIIWSRAEPFFSAHEIKLPSDRWTTAKFTPQKLILSWPNIRLFVSHCGSGGMSEALFFGIPILCFPQGRDQFFNGATVKRLGMPHPLPPNLNCEIVNSSVRDALENYDHYKNVAMNISKMVKMGGGIERAAQLVESLIDIGSAKHLVDFDQDWSWYQKWNVDVLAVTLIVAFVISKFVRFCCRPVIKACRGKSKRKSD